MRTFEEYWTTQGSRKQVESHEERAKQAWDVCLKVVGIHLASLATRVRGEEHYIIRMSPELRDELIK